MNKLIPGTQVEDKSLKDWPYKGSVLSSLGPDMDSDRIYVRWNNPERTVGSYSVSAAKKNLRKVG